ncbi:glycerate kinase [Ligilactobacillus sp. LYQ60]|uniref:glycerate kinase family protein n=1 Tax=unclassified Ligilactobacillus TaxID=2767920 RepID=UPI003854A550
MKIVIAPDSFKGSVTAKEAAQLMMTGMKRVFPKADYELIPMADGGEGTVQSLIDATNGHFITTPVHDPLGRKINARYGLLGDHKTAVIEMAAASGMELMQSKELNPLVATTYGTGELIKNALDHDVKKILIGIGGSATVDGGAGMAQALGAHLLDKKGKELSWGGGMLDKLEQINIAEIDPRISHTQIQIASDVTNPLTGKNGAAMVFGPQKGATPSMVNSLDKNLHHYAQLITRDLGMNVELSPGAGAAGGLGAGLLAFCHAQLKAGVNLIIDTVKLKQRAQDADVVLTGEGKIDFQTQYGKTPFGVARATKSVAPHAPVIVLAGNIGKGIDTLYSSDGIDAIFSTPTGAKPLKQALADTRHDLSQTAEEVGRLIKAFMHS